MISIVVITLDTAVKYALAANRPSSMLEMALIGQYVLLSLKSYLKE